MPTNNAFKIRAAIETRTRTFDLEGQYAANYIITAKMAVGERFELSNPFQDQTVFKTVLFANTVDPPYFT